MKAAVQCRHRRWNCGKGWFVQHNRPVRSVVMLRLIPESRLVVVHMIWMVMVRHVRVLLQVLLLLLLLREDAGRTGMEVHGRRADGRLCRRTPYQPCFIQCFG